MTAPTFPSALILANMDVVFFVYGLAFIALGLVILAQPREESHCDLAESIWLLALFGLAHGTLEWMSLWTFLRGGGPLLEVWKTLFLFASFLFLFEFGRRLTLVFANKEQFLPSRAAVWLGKPLYGAVALGFVALFWLIPDWLLAAKIASRYFLGFGGALLAGVGFLLCARHSRLLQLQSAWHRWARKYFVLAALALLLYGVAAGLMGPPAAIFPANVLNDRWFLDTFGFPVQLLRAVCALLVAIAVGSVLRAFHAEGREKLQNALAAAKDAAIQVDARTRELQEREAHLREITATLGEGVYVLDKARRITFVNPEAQKLLGYGEAELLGADAHGLFHCRRADGSPHAEHQCAIGGVTRSGETYRSENELFWRKDGSMLAVAVCATPILREGEISGSVVVFSDITERKRAARLLEFENHALAVISGNPPLPLILELLCRGVEEILEGALCSILLLDEERACLRHGAAPSLPDDYNREIDGLPLFPEPGPCARAASEGGPVIVADIAAEPAWADFRALAAAHGLRSVWSMPVYSASGSVFGTFAIYHRVPYMPAHADMQVLGRIAHLASIAIQRSHADQELKRLNETLEQRVQEEAQKNRDKDHLLIQQSRLAAMGEMIGNIAHQWRQPLNALGLVLGNIKDAYDYDDLSAEYLEKTTAKGHLLVQKMSATIDDFRNFFRPNREPQVFKLAQAAQGALDLVEASFRNNQLAVELIVKEEVAASGFANEYSQVLLNLLGNAKDAILARQGAAGRVEIEIGRDGDNGYVRVSDNGGGIPEEVIGKIFDPYFTTREKGTGIGLYMSKMIIENNMQGHIEVRNTASGAEFRVVTPLAAIENAGL
jgi:PAS domain S-box-containing protein